MIRRSLWFVLLLWSAGAHAQQVDLYAGGMKLSGDSSEHSYAWGFAYAEPISPHLAASFTWQNEGHVTDHHRDGFAMQLWAHQPLMSGRADIGVGLGPYRYFDTVAVGPNRVYDNHHGVGMMYSAYVGWYFTPHWSATLRANWVRAGGSIDTSSYLVGLGYRFDSGGDERTIPSGETARENTVTVLGGLSVVNSLTSQNARALAVEYRRSIADGLDGTLSLINEGQSDIGHRQGLAAQIWLRHAFFRDRLALSLGLGPYVTWTRYESNPEAAGRQNVVAGMVTMSASYNLSQR